MVFLTVRNVIELHKHYTDIYIYMLKLIYASYGSICNFITKLS
jgi:hypothetical protein